MFTILVSVALAGSPAEPTLWRADCGGPLSVSSVSGALSASEVDSAVSRVDPQLGACYAALLERRPDAAGALAARFTIQSEGIAQVELRADTSLQEEAFFACADQALRSAPFPNQRRSTSATWAVRLAPESLQPCPPAEVIILGALDKRGVDETVAANRASLQACYAQGVATQPELAGKVVVKFQVTEQGAVKKTEVNLSTLESPAVEACVVDAVGGWTFPAPHASTAIVTIPFYFPLE